MLGAFFSFVAWKKGHKRYLTLGILLLITTSMELYVQYLIKKRVDFTYLYHLFIAIEYPLICWFLSDAIRSSSVKKILLLTIPLYLVISLSLSVLHYHFTGFPSLNIELEGIMQSILCTYILFNLEVYEDVSILRNQYFWICSGILIFFGTSFVFNGVITPILRMDTNKTLMLFNMINKPLNLVLYSFIIIGLLCLLTKRKSSTQ